MAKSKLAQYILSEQFMENARRGVAEAVAQTRAAGLIPAGDSRVRALSLIHISEPTRPRFGSRMPSSA